MEEVRRIRMASVGNIFVRIYWIRCAWLKVLEGIIDDLKDEVYLCEMKSGCG